MKYEKTTAIMILILFFKALLLINQVFPECTITDDWKKTYPNLESALRGLDLPAMLPVTSDPASEPGIRTRIFESEEKITHEDESCSIDRLKFIDAFSDIRCNNDFKETVFESLEDLVEGIIKKYYHFLARVLLGASRSYFFPPLLPYPP